MVTPYVFPIFFTFSLAIFLYSLHQTKTKKNSFGETPYLFPLGIFVWADGVIIGLFWSLISFTVYLLRNWKLFLLIFSLFWFVRSLGETIYWLNQQFSPLNRNPPSSLRFHQIFHNDSIWFAYQVFWQCLSVISGVLSVYFGAVWLKQIS